MFRKKAMKVTPRKDDVVVNMVLAITTHSQIPENMVIEEKEPFKKKSLAKWQKEEKLQCSFEKVIEDIKQKEPLEAMIMEE
jgi:hypothetical protein